MENNKIIDRKSFEILEILKEHMSINLILSEVFHVLSEDIAKDTVLTIARNYDIDINGELSE